MNELLERLKVISRNDGACLFAVADIDSGLRSHFHGLERNITDRLKRAVSFAVPIPGPVLDSLTDGPTPLYFFVYRKLNALLDDIALKISSEIIINGGQALPIPSSHIVDWERQLASFSHRHAAVAAGMGWLGSNNLLVTPEFGARLRLCTVLTDLDLPHGKPREDSPPCGECTACADICPANAIGKTAADHNFERCFNALKAFRKTHNVGQYICGLCQKACVPFSEIK